MNEKQSEEIVREKEDEGRKGGGKSEKERTGVLRHFLASVYV